jgi:hypothetical protein
MHESVGGAQDKLWRQSVVPAVQAGVETWTGAACTPTVQEWILRAPVSASQNVSLVGCFGQLEGRGGRCQGRIGRNRGFGKTKTNIKISSDGDLSRLSYDSHLRQPVSLCILQGTRATFLHAFGACFQLGWVMVPRLPTICVQDVFIVKGMLSILLFSEKNQDNRGSQLCDKAMKMVVFGGCTSLLLGCLTWSPLCLETLSAACRASCIAGDRSSPRGILSLVVRTVFCAPQERELRDEDYDLLLALESRSRGPTLASYLASCLPIQVADGNLGDVSPHEAPAACVSCGAGFPSPDAATAALTPRRLPCGHFMHTVRRGFVLFGHSASPIGSNSDRSAVLKMGWFTKGLNVLATVNACFLASSQSVNPK